MKNLKPGVGARFRRMNRIFSVSERRCYVVLRGARISQGQLGQWSYNPHTGIGIFSLASKSVSAMKICPAAVLLARFSALMFSTAVVITS